MSSSYNTPDRDDAVPDLDDAPLDPAQVHEIIRAQRLAVRDGIEPDARVLFGAWGAAWLIGYLVLYASARTSASHTPSGWPFVAFYSLLAAAVVVTIVHIVRRTRGLAGPSGQSGAMYGFSWTIGFVAVVLIMTGLMRAGADAVVVNLGWNALPCLLVGMLYLAGGAMWRSTVLYALGAWIALVGGAATLAGLPGTFLVMALAGGGGLLLGALITHVHEFRSSRRGPAAPEPRSAA